MVALIVGGSSSGGGDGVTHSRPTTLSTTDPPPPPPPTTVPGEPVAKDVLNRALIKLTDLPDGFDRSSPLYDVDELAIGGLPGCSAEPIVAEGLVHRSDRAVFASDQDLFAVVSEAVSFYPGGAKKYLAEIRRQAANCTEFRQRVTKLNLGDEALRAVGIESLYASFLATLVFVRIGDVLSMTGYALRYSAHEDFVLLEHLGRVAERRLREVTG